MHSDFPLADPALPLIVVTHPDPDVNQALLLRLEAHGLPAVAGPVVVLSEPQQAEGPALPGPRGELPPALLQALSNLVLEQPVPVTAPAPNRPWYRQFAHKERPRSRY